MDFEGRYLFHAKRDAVWAALNDTRVLQAVIPGCEEIAWTGPDTLDVSVRVNLGIVHPLFAGGLVLSDVHAARHYVLSGHGRGGMLGLARASARITLEDAPEGTVLSFAADGSADGNIMRLGRALIGKSAQKLVDGFFEAIGREMGAIVAALPRAQGVRRF